jgi:hypothetical protein
MISLDDSSHWPYLALVRAMHPDFGLYLVVK